MSKTTKLCIGECKVDEKGNITLLKREFFGQGNIFKDEDAFFNHPDKPCYVPETSDDVYTKEDFLSICGGQEDIAQILFEDVDWQHPETRFEELYVEGELITCEECETIYETYKHLKCPHCHKAA